MDKNTLHKIVQIKKRKRKGKYKITKNYRKKFRPTLMTNGVIIPKKI
jgi:hypothetical protein